jgi:hypothetical protein
MQHLLNSYKEFPSIPIAQVIDPGMLENVPSIKFSCILLV